MSLKVLLIDDNKFDIDLHVMMAEISGLSSDPICLVNGKEAIEYLDGQYQSADFYLLFLDINMPVMNGWEFLDTIQTKPFAGTVAVVMVTSSVNESDKNKVKQYTQVIDYVEKPLDLEICNQIMSLPQIKHLF